MLVSALLATAFAAAAGVASFASNEPRNLGVADLEARDLEVRQQRFTTQYWANDFASLNWTSGPAGQFNLTWNNGFGGNFVVGKGYRPSTDMLFNYSGTFDVARNGWAYLTLYGWTRNPLVEWYVIEAMGAHNPSDNRSATLYGHVDSDGATYEVWQKKRTNAPSIDGDNTDFEQYWSVRTSMHCGGTINTGNHWRAWKEMGLELGTHQYMALAVEGQRGAGSADLTAGVGPTTRVPETPTPTFRSETAKTHSTVLNPPKSSTTTRATSTSSSSSSSSTSSSSSSSSFSSSSSSSSTSRSTSSSSSSSSTTRRTTSTTRRTTSTTTRRTSTSSSRSVRPTRPVAGDVTVPEPTAAP